MAKRRKLQLRTDELKARAREAVELGAKMTLSDAIRDAKRRVSVGTTGDLERSIIIQRVYWDRGILHGLWGTTLEYGLYVEVGTGPHMPPVDALKQWAQRHLGSEDAAWGLALHIAKHGTKEHPYLRPAADEHYSSLARNIKRAWEKMSAGRSNGA